MQMYQFIFLFQICCMIAAGLGLYLAASEKELRKFPCDMPVLGTLLGVFIMEAGYGLYLQAEEMSGLQVARKICLFGKLLAAVFFILTCRSLSESFRYHPPKSQIKSDDAKEKSAARSPLSFSKRSLIEALIAAAALSAAAFIFADGLQRYIFSDQTFCQNQFFYYIQDDLTPLGKAGFFLLRILPLAGILRLIFSKKQRSRPENFLLSASIFIYMLAIVCQNAPVFRHYDITMPLAAAFSICLVIFAAYFVAYHEKKMYTKQ